MWPFSPMYNRNLLLVRIYEFWPFCTCLINLFVVCRRISPAKGAPWANRLVILRSKVDHLVILRLGINRHRTWSAGSGSYNLSCLSLSNWVRSVVERRSIADNLHSKWWRQCSPILSSIPWAFGQSLSLTCYVPRKVSLVCGLENFGMLSWR